MISKKVMEGYWEIYEEALRGLSRNPDGSVSRIDLLTQMESLIIIDEKAERKQKAKRIYDALCKTGHADEITGQLCFENEGTWPWNPRRLIQSADGKVIENQFALYEYKVADAQRSGKHMTEVQASYRRKRHEADVHSDWTFKMLAAGANPKDLTWGRCVEALGILDPLGGNGGNDDSEPDENEDDE